jgi:hypothetical protein
LSGRRMRTDDLVFQSKFRRGMGRGPSRTRSTSTCRPLASTVPRCRPCGTPCHPHSQAGDQPEGAAGRPGCQSLDRGRLRRPGPANLCRDGSGPSRTEREVIHSSGTGGDSRRPAVELEHPSPGGARSYPVARVRPPSSDTHREPGSAPALRFAPLEARSCHIHGAQRRRTASAASTSSIAMLQPVSTHHDSHPGKSVHAPAHLLTARFQVRNEISDPRGPSHGKLPRRPDR